MRKVIIIAVAVAFLGLSHLYAAIYSPEKRTEMIEDGNRVLGREVVFIDADLADRLAGHFGEEAKQPIEEVEEVTEELTPKELIERLANLINPTGVFFVNGDYYLILKEKRIKSGDILPIRYQGREYNVLLSEVVRNAFTIQVGEEELQIKLK